MPLYKFGYYLKCISLIIPRQARDKHRESCEKRRRFLQARGSARPLASRRTGWSTSQSWPHSTPTRRRHPDHPHSYIYYALVVLRSKQAKTYENLTYTRSMPISESKTRPTLAYATGFDVSSAMPRPLQSSACGNTPLFSLQNF